MIVLSSGGLDSLLAMKILDKAGLEVLGVHFFTWFNTPKYSLPEDFLGEKFNSLGFRIINIDLSEAYTETLLNPRYGYGRGVNPCLDCKILFFTKAKEMMEHTGAHFVATGEVLGQRPMTQRPDAMRLIEKRSGLSGYLLRPLSAKLLAPTIPEQLGWVDRSLLFDFSGRSRARQIELAREFGIERYPSPAGGCILTEKQFGARFRDLLRYSSKVDTTDLTILRYGRHFRLGLDCKLVLGRHQRENEFLERLGWGNLRLEPLSTPGPLGLLTWTGEKSYFKTALDITARYSDHGGVPVSICFRVGYAGRKRELSYRGIPDKFLCEEKLVK